MSKSRTNAETLRTALVAGDVTNANFTGADLELGKGGTGASTAGAARTALGLAIGTNVLAPNGSGSNLTGISTDPTRGTLTKTFQSNETATINLTSAVSPTPVVGVTKEVSQVGVSSKGVWDVAPTGNNYTLQNTATAVTLTPSSATANGTFSLGSGSFAAADLGKKITGNSGSAILISTAGAYIIVTPFANTNAIASGSWQMYALKIDTTNGITLNSVNKGNTLVGAVYANKQSINLIGNSNQGLWISPDGTKMYNLNSQTNRVVQYTLSTPHDISTVVHTALSFLYSGTASSAYGLFFSPDGTRMYIHAQTGDVMYQFTLSTAFNVSTASYANLSFDTSAQSPDTIDVHMKSDGTMWYHIDENDRVYQYSMSTAWNISTSSYVGNYNSASQVTRGYGLSISTDGTKMFIQCDTTYKIFQYTLSTPHTVSTASYDSVFLANGNENASMSSLFLKADGSILYTVGNDGNRKAYQYKMGGFLNVSGQYHPAITAATGQIDSQYWTDINTMTADQISGIGTVSYAVSTDNHAIWKTAKNGVGIRSIARNNSGTWQYNNASAVVGHGISTGSYDSKSYDTSAQDPTGTTDVAFKSDGLSMFVLSQGNDRIYQYTLSTAFDVSTASYASKSLHIYSQEQSPSGISFKPDGTIMYLIGTNDDRILQYTLSTAWDISTGSYASKNLSVASQENAPQALAFKSDGTKAYVSGESDYVYQYSLSTAWDVSTGSYDSVSFNGGSQDTSPVGIAFNSDGTKMFLLGGGSKTVYQYNLGTAWDVSSASYSLASFSVGSQDGFPSGLSFSNNGQKMFISGLDSNTIFQYSTVSQGFTTSETWVNGTVNNELATIQQSLNATEANIMNKAQLDAVVDANQFTVGDTLDLMVAPYMASVSTSLPSSDGVSINYDAAVLNKGAILGTDYDYDFPANNRCRIKSLSAQNLKVKIV